ncbi:MAG: putative membrane protein [Algoriphagus sp.]|jgi:putative membrane protein
MKEKSDLILRDKLAIERTHLANERTFLAYFRTAFFFLASGITLLKVDYFFEIQHVGWIFVGIFPIILVLGIIRLVRVKSNVEKMY